MKINYEINETLTRQMEKVLHKKERYPYRKQAIINILRVLKYDEDERYMNVIFTLNPLNEYHKYLDYYLTKHNYELKEGYFLLREELTTFLKYKVSHTERIIEETLSEYIIPCLYIENDNIEVKLVEKIKETNQKAKEMKIKKAKSIKQEIDEEFEINRMSDEIHMLDIEAKAYPEQSLRYDTCKEDIKQQIMDKILWYIEHPEEAQAQMLKAYGEEYVKKYRARKQASVKFFKGEYYHAPVYDETCQDSNLREAIIYGIVIENEIVYIGMTHRKYLKRFTEHIKATMGIIDGANQTNRLYKDMRQHEGEYKFVILFDKGKNYMSQRQLEMLECGYIDYYQPKYNYLGMKMPYRYTKKRDKSVKLNMKIGQV